MIELIDFSECLLSSRNLQYGGRAGEKRGIIYQNEFWFLKFPKNAKEMRDVKTLSYITSPLSEYIGSNIYKILGYGVHETFLGVCFDGIRYKTVCACKDFINDEKNEVLIPYTALRNDTAPVIMEYRENSTGAASNLNEIIFQLEHNTILSNIIDAKERFWDVVVIDMLINNNDRNEDNWGVIKYKKENVYKLAPIFDCGNSFHGKTGEDKIEKILNDNERLMQASLGGVTAYEDDNGNQITVLKLCEINNNDFLKACERVYNKVHGSMDDIIKMINEIPESYNGLSIMSSMRKKYYIKTLELRIDYILKNILN